MDCSHEVNEIAPPP